MHQGHHLDVYMKNCLKVWIISKIILNVAVFSAAHDDDWKLRPCERGQSPGYLSWCQPAAGHTAQQSGLPAGAHQELQEQTQSSEAPQLVCSNCKGTGVLFYSLKYSHMVLCVLLTVRALKACLSFPFRGCITWRRTRLFTGTWLPGMFSWRTTTQHRSQTTALQIFFTVMTRNTFTMRSRSVH